METLGGFLDRNEIGKVLHLTRDEAEAALRKEQLRQQRTRVTIGNGAGIMRMVKSEVNRR